MILMTNAQDVHNELAPLYCLYDGVCTPQNAYIELDCGSRRLFAEYDVETGGGVPARVWQGHNRRYSVSCYLTGRATAEILTNLDVKKVVESICDLYDKSTLSEFVDSFELDELESELNTVISGLSNEFVEVFDTLDWLDTDMVVTPDWEYVESLEWQDGYIDGDTVDSELKRLATEIEEFAANEKVLISDDVLAVLTGWRDECRDNMSVGAA